MLLRDNIEYSQSMLRKHISYFHEIHMEFAMRIGEQVLSLAVNSAVHP